MNKYQEALNAIKTEPKIQDYYGDYINFFDKDDEDIALLQELVDKATPKNVDLSCDTLVCPYCETGRIYDWENEKRFKYCADCGQALDWSTDE